METTSRVRVKALLTVSGGFLAVQVALTDFGPGGEAAAGAWFEELASGRGVGPRNDA